jgi:hypothetical protein
MKPKSKPPGKKRKQITHLFLDDGSTVTDPAEIERLLKANGFAVDELTGAVGVGSSLWNKAKPS